MIHAFLEKGTIYSDSDMARDVWHKSQIGVKGIKGRITFSPFETYYLFEKGKLRLYVGKKQISDDNLIQKLTRLDKSFALRYPVFSHLRTKGYVVKTGLKFGADFRVYDKGVAMGEDHAKWVVYCVRESDSLKWHDFAAKNRVSHSTRKRLLIAVVDDEQDVSFFEVDWVKV